MFKSTIVFFVLAFVSLTTGSYVDKCENLGWICKKNMCERCHTKITTIRSTKSWEFMVPVAICTGFVYDPEKDVIYVEGKVNGKTFYMGSVKEKDITSEKSLCGKNDVYFSNGCINIKLENSGGHSFCVNVNGTFKSDVEDITVNYDLKCTKIPKATYEPSSRRRLDKLMREIEDTKMMGIDEDNY